MRELDGERRGFDDHDRRGWAVGRVARCRGAGDGVSRGVVEPDAKPAPIGTPRTFLLCALEAPGRPSKSVTVAADAPTFAPLVSALSLPDDPTVPGTVCALYADLPQVVLARTGAGVFQVSIPVDGCRHYLRSALTALQDARAG